MLTFDTAVRLKDAGFPQPEIAPLQWWYDPFGKPLIAIIARRPHRLIELPDPDRLLFLEDTAAYAPTAAEILPLLPPAFRIGWGQDGFVILEQLSEDAEYAVGFHRDMDEAAALLWLEIKEK